MTVTSPLTLNKGQQEASNKFFQFLLSDRKEFGITGPGGTGKTKLQGHIIDDIIPQYHTTCKMMGVDAKFNTVDMTATTNKAAEVLSLDTNRPTETVYSFLNLKVTDDFSTGKSKVTETRAWHVHENKILFIDECSMIDSTLYQYIQKGLINSKIVYVGDHCQMAPVQESLSPVFRQGIEWVELTEPMRTKVPALHAINQQLRETVETGEFKPIQIVPGIIDYLDDTQMQNEIKNYFTQQTLNSRILAYTNQRVVEFNDYIRDLRQLPDEYTVGEFLVNNNAIRLRNSMLSVEEEVEILSLGHPQNDMIDNNISMDVRLCSFRTRLGNVFTDVPLPVDREYFRKLVQYYSREKNWNRYFHLKNNYPDLRQRDASTVYKAQGSTYDVVFIDLGNISTCHIPAQVARQLYVAFSRARTRVFLFGQLASKYGGLKI